MCGKYADLVVASDVCGENADLGLAWVVAYEVETRCRLDSLDGDQRCVERMQL